MMSESGFQHRSVNNRNLTVDWKEDRYKLAFFVTTDGVWDLDLESGDMFYSPEWKNIVGYKDEELGNDLEVWESLVHPDDLIFANQQLEDSIANKDYYMESEYRMRHKDGKWINILSRALVLLDGQGEPRRVVGTHIDITQRKKIRSMLEESEKLWRFALNSNDDGVWDWNILSDEVYYSKRWKEMLGFSEEELENNRKEWEKRVHPDDLESAYIAVQLHLDGKTPMYTNEYRLKSKDGSYKWILDRGRIFTYADDGSPLRFIGTHTDISEQKERESEMKKLNEEKSKYFSVLAHDLRNLVGSSTQLSELFLNPDFKRDNEKVGELGEMLHQRNKQAMELLENLLEWGRVSMSEGFGSFETCTVSVSLEQVIQHVKELADTKNIEIILNSKEELKILGNVFQLNTVFRNLLFNAIKYSPTDDRIIIATERQSEMIQIGFSNFGESISKQKQKEIFNLGNEPKVGTANEKGTGFGLVISKEIVEKHGGEIWVESEEGEGVTFYLLFPAVD